MKRRKIYKYKSGLVFIWHRLKSVNGVTFRLNFNAGSYNDPKNKQGLAHLVEHMLCSFSNKKFDRKNLYESLQRFPMKNAFTSFRDMAFVGTAPKEKFESLLDSSTSCFLGLTNAVKEFEDEKEIVTQEAVTLSRRNAGQRTYLDLSKLEKDKFHKNLNEGRMAGTKESISRLTLKDAQKFIDDYFCQNNAVMLITGNLSFRKAKKLVDEYVVARLKEKGKVGYGYDDYGGLKSGQFITEEPWEEKKSMLYINWEFCKRDRYISRKENFIGILATNIINDMAFKKFRMDNKSCYSAYFGLNNNYKIKEFEFIVECDHDKVELNYEIFKDFIKDIKQNGIDKETFEKQKTKYLDNYNLDYSTIRAILDRDLSQYTAYGNLMNKKEMKESRKMKENITYEEINDYVLKALVGKPNIILLIKPEIAKKIDIKDIKKIVNTKAEKIKET